jgi:hypothetical protein
MTHVGCSRDHTGRLEFEEQPIGIIDLWAFDFNGRVFAYRLSYERQAMQNGTRVRLGSASEIMFLDVDGSGKFTLCKSAIPPFLFTPKVVPDWVKGGPATAPNK